MPREEEEEINFGSQRAPPMATNNTVRYACVPIVFFFFFSAFLHIVTAHRYK